LARGRAQVLLAALLFSTGGAAIKACTLSSWQVAGLRSGIAALTLLVLLPEARRRWSARAVAVGAAYATTMVLYVLANKLTTAANTIFLQSSAPLYLLLLAPWLLGEPLRGRDLRFMGLLAVGMALFFVGTQAPVVTAPDPWLGDVLAAASGVTWALTILGLRWLAAEGPAADTGGALVAGNVLAFVVCLPALRGLGAPTIADGVLVGYLGTCQIGLAYLCLSRGVARVPALEASLLLLVEPVMNALWAWMIHAEAPGALPLAGGGIILAATAWRARPG
jgi:drug/metabolite transporter (DMT)-like permease